MYSTVSSEEEAASEEEALSELLGAATAELGLKVYSARVGTPLVSGRRSSVS